MQGSQGRAWGGEEEAEGKGYIVREEWVVGIPRGGKARSGRGGGARTAWASLELLGFSPLFDMAEIHVALLGPLQHSPEQGFPLPWAGTEVA